MKNYTLKKYSLIVYHGQNFPVNVFCTKIFFKKKMFPFTFQSCFDIFIGNILVIRSGLPPTHKYVMKCFCQT